MYEIESFFLFFFVRFFFLVFNFCFNSSDEIIDENEFLNLLKKLYRDRNDKEFLTKEKITKFFKYYCNPEVCIRLKFKLF